MTPDKSRRDKGFVLPLPYGSPRVLENWQPTSVVTACGHEQVAFIRATAGPVLEWVFL